MRFKFILAIALILYAFCVLPVSANAVISYQEGTINLGDITDETLTVEFSYNAPTGCYIYQLFINNENQGSLYAYSHTGNNYNFKWDIPLDKDANTATTNFRLIVAQIGEIPIQSMIINYNYVEPITPDKEFDIDIDLTENTINLGVINSLKRTLTIGSSSNRVVKQYTSYNSQSCSIDSLEKGYVTIDLDENFNSSRIGLSGYALLNDVQSDFSTQVFINYTYMPLLDLIAYIQTFDYQTGNMLSGVNLSVYEVIDHDRYAELGTLIYSSQNAQSQTVLQLKNNTDYFVKNELTGYFAVKNTNYPYFNNEYGYWWANPVQGFNPLMLYYSRLDPTAQYEVGYIVQDTSNNGISGVSVTMDNSITKITNSIGGVHFNNVSSGTHSFVFVKNGYQSAQVTEDIQLQYATFYQTLFKDNQIIQPTISPTAYPTTYPTASPSAQPTLSPIDKPSNIMESVSFGFAKIFGIKTVENANYIFALMLILFPAVVAGGITHQALGFIAGGMIGFVFALAVGLIPIWVFFAMCLLAVIYFVLKGGNEGF